MQSSGLSKLSDLSNLGCVIFSKTFLKNNKNNHKLKQNKQKNILKGKLLIFFYKVRIFRSVDVHHAQLYALHVLMH